MTLGKSNTLVIACGALAKEITVLTTQLDTFVELVCLPAGFHNHPEKIVPGLEAVLRDKAQLYERVLIGYGDCGTGGQIDKLISSYPNVTRLPGAHCYAFYSGLNRFDEMVEEEIGTFFLTDYLVRQFDTIIMKGMGLDRHPEWIKIYFKNYKKLVYISQTKDSSLIAKSKEAALRLGLSYENRHVGYGALAVAMSLFGESNIPIVSSNV